MANHDRTIQTLTRRWNISHTEDDSTPSNSEVAALNTDYDKCSTVNEQQIEDAKARHAEYMAISADWKKPFRRQQRSKARKNQGDNRGYWAELLKRWPLPKGYSVVPDEALSHKAKISRTLALKRREECREKRRESAKSVRLTAIQRNTRVSHQPIT